MSSEKISSPSETLAHISSEIILQTIEKFHKNTKKLQYQNPNSMFGRAAKDLTKCNSTIAERKYLCNLWESRQQPIHGLQLPTIPVTHPKGIRKKNRQSRMILQNPSVIAEANYIIQKHLNKNAHPKLKNKLPEHLPNQLTSNSQQHPCLHSSLITNTNYSSKRKEKSPTKSPGVFKRIRRIFKSNSEQIVHSMSTLQLTNQQQSRTTSAPINNSTSKNIRSSSDNYNEQHPESQIHHHSHDDSASENEPEQLPQIDSQLERIIQKFNNTINTFPSTVCPICERLMYNIKQSFKSYTFDSKTIKQLRDNGFQCFQERDVIRTCRRCHDNLSKARIPPTAYFNKMRLPTMPPQISALNDIEAKFISQVRPFMRIFYLSRGQGQLALKGSAIHFPQSVDQIIETLPLNKHSADVMLIKETNDNFNDRCYEVRPRVLYEALKLLKQINPLYANVNIQEVPEEDLVVPILISNVSSNIINNDQGIPVTGYILLNENVSILHGTFHQHSAVLPPSKINKSNTISIAAIAYTTLQPINTWSSSDIDNVLSIGKRYYDKLVPDKESEQPSLHQISGQITCFESTNVTCNVQIDQATEGFLKGVPGLSLNNIKSRLLEFIQSSSTHALLLVNKNCFAFHKLQNHVYFFDCFSRGKKGKTAANGKACIIKCTFKYAIAYFSEHIHRICPTPTTWRNDLTAQEKEHWHFYFVPVFTSYDSDKNKNQQQNEPTPQPDTTNNINNIATYIFINEFYDILRATIHQGSPRFANAGLQCCAMSASAAAHSIFWPLDNWDQNLLDQVIVSGDNFYTNVLPSRNRMLDSMQLHPMNIVCYQNAEVSCRVAQNTYFGGSFDSLPQYPGENITRLHESIQAFLEHEDYNNAIFTANGYCMALLKQNSKLYLFDSHSRDSHGMPSENGTAVIIRFNELNTSINASNFIHRLCAPPAPTLSILNEIQRSRHAFVIIPINFNTLREPVLNNVLPQANDAGIIPDDSACLNSQNQEEPPHLQTTSNLPTHQNPLLLDCVVRADQPDDPTLAAFIQETRNPGVAPQCVNIQREQGHALYPSKEKRLEELSFIKAFPFGELGFEEERRIKITPLDYFQNRLMGTNPNFHTTEYLFYALSRVEAYIIQQKISVCGNMVANNGVQNEDQDEFRLPGLENVHLYMGGVRGSGSYWKTYTGNVLAMIEQLGVPTFFLTISYDDLNAIDSLTMLWKAKYGPDAELPSLPSDIPYDVRRQLLNDYPIAAARHFNNRMNAILNILLQDGEQLFGHKVTDFTYRVEFQGRGSPHIHMIIWLENQPNWNSPEGMHLIEQNISCSLEVPYRHLVMRYQNHSHRGTCFKKHNECRFGFPRSPSLSTKILDEDEIARQHGRFLEIKRTDDEIMINNYHPKLLQLLKCNMDIQAVTGTRAIAFYIGKYMSKGEPTYLRQEIRDIINNVKADSRSSYHQKALRIANVIIKHREICAQECAFRLLHLRLRNSSRSFVFVPTYKPENRLRMVRKDTMFNNDPQLGLNIIDRYMLRPNVLAILCLLEFAAWWTPRRNKFTEDPDRDLSDDEEEDSHNLQNLIDKPQKLKQNKGHIVKRKRAAIVQYPRFKPVDQTEDYLYSMILLHLPIEQENFSQGFDNIRDAFNQLKNHFRTNQDDSIINPDQADKITDILRQLENTTQQDDSGDIEHDHLNVFEEEQAPLRQEEVFIPNENTNVPLHERVRTLTPEQRVLYERVRTQIVSGNTSQMLLFLSGSGGTGKSYCIQTITELITTLCPGGTRAIIKAAPTGVAARNINGVTLHRAFSLGIETHSVAQYMKLGGRLLHERRLLYNQVLFIIIDEISMVSYEVFRQIHLRCTEIFQNDAPFGGVNIILSGDLLQLCPCRGKNIYDQPSYLSHEQNLWRLFDFLELKTVMRQREGNHFLNLLNRLRIGTLVREDVATLRQRLLDPTNPLYSEMVNSSKDSLHLYPKVKQVDEYNDIVLKAAQYSGAKIYSLKSRDTYGSGLKFGQPVPDDLLYKDYRKCAGISTLLNMAVGSKVMLKVNIEPLAGLANGTIGILRKFVWTALRRDQQTSGDLPEYVLVEFDGLIADRHLVTEPGFERCTMIRPRSFEFIGKRGVKIMRYQLPLVLCASCSIHKAQGMSLDQCTIYCGKHIFKQGQLYVALSRVRTFEGLFITSIDENRLLVNKRGTGPANEKALRELQLLILCQFLELTYDQTTKCLIDSLVTFRVQYVMCQLCKWWVCDCRCP